MGRPIFPQRTDLYRHYDARGRLLYVGISLSAITRLSAHRNGSHWSDQICRIEIDTFDDRNVAIAAERRAIQEESPIYNRAHKEAASKSEADFATQSPVAVTGPQNGKGHVDLPFDRLLRLPKVIELTGLGRDSIYRLARQSNFPKPVKLSERASAWHENDVRAWMRSRPAYK
jgi:predicted DNA-binding transcriptional regulator AlpA